MTIASASAAVPAAPSPLAASPAPAAILAAAHHLLPHLERGQPVDAATLRGAMEAAFGASDTSGAWDWKTAYEACEVATVLFLRKDGKAVFRKSGSPAASLPMLAKIASLLPTHTRRSEETQAFQQFSTPVSLGLAALAAAAITPVDRVLEPSAGTGLLAVLAETAGATLMLNELRLPTIKQLWPTFAERSDKEGWPAARFLSAITEHEIAERGRRRMERHLAEAKLLPGKTLDTFDFDAVPMISKAQVMAICAGDSWLENGANLILFGPPGGGKSHLSSGIGLALIEKGWRVLFVRTSDLVQKLQVARRELALENAINRLDRFDLLILDDLAYVAKDQAETSVLFELISARYERRSLMITANQPFGEWNRVFPDPAMTLAAVDRLVHHATIFEMNVESYRRRTAIERKQQGAGRPAKVATAKNTDVSLPDNQPET